MSEETTVDPQDTTLAARCFEQIKAEHTMLTTLLASVQEIRSALMSRDVGALDETMQRPLLQASPEHLSQRAMIAKQVSIRRNCAESDVTLSTLVTFVENSSQTDVQPLFREITRLRSEIENMNQGNMIIASSMAKMIDRFMHRAYGSPSSTTYGRDGELTRSGPVGLIERSA